MEADPSLPTTSTPPDAAVAVETPTGKRRYPVMTWVSCAICIVIFLGLLKQRDRYSWEALETWGCYPATKIRAGALWGFITSAFVHLELWHVAFNVYWLYVLGSRLEL